CEAGRNEAYTTTGAAGTAGHTIVRSASAANQGDMGFEIVFHEASHTVDDQIVKAIEEERRRQGLAQHDHDLWHAVIFYTTGGLVKRELGKADDASYRPSAYRYGVYERGEWPKFRTALEADWQPYLDGRVTYEIALRNLVRDAAR